MSIDRIWVKIRSVKRYNIWVKIRSVKRYNICLMSIGEGEEKNVRKCELGVV